jgi:hypothetical protein
MDTFSVAPWVGEVTQAHFVTFLGGRGTSRETSLNNELPWVQTTAGSVISKGRVG